jgi:uncharacterized protein YprB with RNaseH-like and TPR domain
MARILIWDLESTGLKMDFATLLCAGYKWLGEKKVYVPSITDYDGWEDDPTNDKKLVADFVKIYNSADMTVTYFGTGFDRKALIAKALEHNLPLPANIPMIDLFYTVKSNMAISRKSLQNVGYYLGLSHEKTPVEGKIWRRAMSGHSTSIKYIKDHCESDVLILEEAYLKLRPLVRTHPRVSSYENCGVCGCPVMRRGPANTIFKGAQFRYQCKNKCLTNGHGPRDGMCGRWETRAAAD